MTERIHLALDYLTPAEFEAMLIDYQSVPLISVSSICAARRPISTA